MTPELQDRVINRLVETGASDKPWALVILAALEGAEQLEAYLDGAKSVTAPVSRQPGAAAKRVEPPGVYVASISAEGFRGVGPSATLTLHPGPGLTLVVGRNGSGKSSFAEGLEFLLTGRNYRWDKRPKVWIEGWRNLHQHDAVSLKADLLVEGQGPVLVLRMWKSANLAEVLATARPAGKPAQSLDSLGWDDALVTFRPFLSYNELGSLLEEGPSKLYDALSSVLGLEELVEVQDLLAAARKDRQSVVDEAKAAGDALEQLSEDVGNKTADPRPTAAALALKGPTWDLAALDVLVRGDSGGQATAELDLLRRLEGLAPPDVRGVADVIDRLRAVERAFAAFAGTNAERSRERARLLEDALRFHEKHQVTDCPVCGAEGVLSASWRTTTGAAIAQLKQEATACDAADARRKAVAREAQKFISAPPPVLAEAAGLGLESVPEARRRWSVWSEARDLDSASALADHLEREVLEFAEAVRALAEDVQSELRRREDVWRPVAAGIAGWLPQARAALRAASVIAQIKSAEAWWKEGQSHA